MFESYFVGGGGEFESAAGASVEFVGDEAEVFLAVAAEVGAFGEVLAQEPVGVFFGCSLPECVGAREVDVDVGALSLFTST